MGMCLEVRGNLHKVVSYRVGSKDWTRVVGK